METRRRGWIGPLLVLLVIVGLSLGTMAWVTGRLGTAFRSKPGPTQTPARVRSSQPPRASVVPRAVVFPDGTLKDHSFPLEGAHATLRYAEMLVDDEVAKVSIVGIGMRSHSGVAQKMFSALADEGVNIKVITTSEIKVSVLVAEDYTELALRALHTAYGLDT